MLESDYLIDNFQIYKNENVIKVESDRENEIYRFDENDNLINPQIFKIQKEIEKLEKQKKELENKLKLLTTQFEYDIIIIEMRKPNLKEREMINMAKRKVNGVQKVTVDKNAAQFMRTAENLARKGKTNKKLNGRNANLKAKKYAIA